MNDWQPYFEALRSEECACGRSKQKGRSFCYGCYQALPRGLQVDIYLRLGQGYEEAYEASVKHLEEMGRIRE